MLKITRNAGDVNVMVNYSITAACCPKMQEIYSLEHETVQKNVLLQSDQKPIKEHCDL